MSVHLYPEKLNVLPQYQKPQKRGEAHRAKALKKLRAQVSAKLEHLDK